MRSSWWVPAQLRAMAEDPAGAPADFVAQTLHVADQQGFIEPGRYLSERQPHPTDTHPPTVQRIESAGVAIDDGLLARAARPVDPAELAAAEGLFADWPGLCQAVTAQLQDLAVAQQQRHLAQVAAAASAVGDTPVELHEPRRYLLVTLGLTALFCLPVAAGLVWLLTNGSPTADGGTDPVLLWGAVAFALGGLAACLSLVRLARNREPFLVLTLDGLRSPGFERVVPWLAVTGVTVAAGRGVTTILTLAPEQPLLALDKRGVTFRYKDYRREGAERYRSMTLPTDEFIRWFLLHVLPCGFHRIRHYGLLASSGRRDNLARARELLGAPTPPPAPEPDEAEPADPRPACPCCGGRMLIPETFERCAQPRQPPRPTCSSGRTAP